MVQPFEDPTGPQRVGRFGWKGGIATVESFSLDAALNEMGLTSPELPFENAPNGDLALLAQCDSVADPEDLPDASGVRRTERFTDFQRLLAAPAQTPRSGMTGEAVFEAIGCADCHVARYTTGIAPEAALSGQLIQPYSDFLLHDMGLLGDGIVEGDATETEMMTRPLWGLVQRNAYLHDGRALGGTFADNVESAIAEHGGTAAPSAAAYQALGQQDKDAVIDFLTSLGSRVRLGREQHDRRVRLVLRRALRHRPGAGDTDHAGRPRRHRGRGPGRGLRPRRVRQAPARRKGQ